MLVSSTAEHVRLELAAVVLDAELLERAHDAEARIRDGHVEAPVAHDRERDGRVEVGAPRHVADVCDGLRARGRELRAQGLESLAPARHEHELRAFTRELARERGAYTGRRAGDQNSLTLKLHVAFRRWARARIQCFCYLGPVPPPSPKLYSNVTPYSRGRPRTSPTTERGGTATPLGWSRLPLSQNPPPARLALFE